MIRLLNIWYVFYNFLLLFPLPSSHESSLLLSHPFLMQTGLISFIFLVFVSVIPVESYSLSWYVLFIKSFHHSLCLQKVINKKLFHIFHILYLYSFLIFQVLLNDVLDLLNIFFLIMTSFLIMIIAFYFVTLVLRPFYLFYFLMSIIFSANFNAKRIYSFDFQNCQLLID